MCRGSVEGFRQDKKNEFYSKERKKERMEGWKDGRMEMFRMCVGVC